MTASPAGSSPSDNGFTVDFALAGAGVDVPEAGHHAGGRRLLHHLHRRHRQRRTDHQRGRQRDRGQHQPGRGRPGGQDDPDPDALHADRVRHRRRRRPADLPLGADRHRQRRRARAWSTTTSSTGPLFRMFGTRADVSLEEALQSPSPDINLATRDPSPDLPGPAQVAGRQHQRRDRHVSGGPGAPPLWCRCPRSTATREFLPDRALRQQHPHRPASSTSG